MANSIVFQNNPEQLKASLYGYNSTTKAYTPIPVTSTGLVVSGDFDISVIGTVTKVSTIGTLGTVTKVTNVGTLALVTKVTEVGTLASVTKVSNVGTLGTVTKVTNVGTLTKVANIGTLAKVSAIGTVSKVSQVDAVSGTVNVNVAGRNFYSTIVTVTVPASAATTSTVSKTSDLIDVSKFADTSYYIRNITTGSIANLLNIRMQATPSSATSTFPLVNINETATLNSSNPVLVTTDYYLKFNAVKVTSSFTGKAQTIQIVMNGRY